MSFTNQRSCVAGFPWLNAWKSLLFCCGLTTAIVGCSERGPRADVSGEVTVDSQPLRQGTISLLPNRGHRGPSATTTIQDGRFQFDNQTGPIPGKHLAMVSAGAQLPDGRPVMSTDQASGVAKRAPSRTNQGRPANSEQRPGNAEPKTDDPSPTTWEMEIEVPALDSEEFGKPLQLDFYTGAVSAE